MNVVGYGKIKIYTPYSQCNQVNTCAYIWQYYLVTVILMLMLQIPTLQCQIIQDMVGFRGRWYGMYSIIIHRIVSGYHGIKYSYSNSVINSPAHHIHTMKSL